MRRAVRVVLCVLVAVAATAATANALPRSARITTAGLGAIKIGMTERQVERAGGRAITLQEGGSGPSCATAALGQKTYGLFTGGRLAYVSVGTRRYATRSGVRVGDSESKLLATYQGRLVREPHAYDRNGSYLKFVDGNRKIVFTTDGRTVQSITAGRKPEVDYVEACS